jgi:hypothetical protein
MVAIDTGMVIPGRAMPFNSKSLIAMAAAATALLAAAAFAWHGFGDNGLRAASAIATRFASLVFFAALAAGPISRLFPGAVFRAIGAARRDVLLAFCASYALYVISVIGPHLLWAEGLTAGMAGFTIFSSIILAAMAGASTGWFESHLGKPAQRAILGVAAAYFWLCFVLAGIAHISGPHRPDGYYGFCLSLMVAALLLRFADSFRAHLRGAMTVS